MDFYLTSLQSGERLRFPLLPDRLNVRTGAMTVALNIIKTGEVKIPRGSILTGYSWNGILPSEAMQDMSFVYDWQPPARIIDLLRRWEDEGQTLRFMVTDLSINVDVFIEAFTYDYYGAGNVSYTINLTIRRELTITTVPPKTDQPATEDKPGSSDSGSDGKKYGTVKLNNKNSSLNVRQKASTSSKSLGKLKHGTRVEILGKSGNWYIIPYAKGTGGKAYVHKNYIKLDGSSSGGSSSGSSSKSGSSSSSSSSSSTYKVKKGDSLYSIAKAVLGDGSRWQEIYNMNKAAIDAANKGQTVSKYTLAPETTLKLPAKKSTKKTTSKVAKTVKSAVSTVASAVQSYVTKNPSNTVVKVVTNAVKTASSVLSKVAGLFKK